MLYANYRNLELRHLRYFLAVAEELHFGRAAERLFITQPTLSRQIQDLEAELEVTLFERTKRSVTLTRAGTYFYDEITRLFDTMDQSIRELKQVEQGRSGELTIGFTSASLNMVVPALLQNFFKGRPDVRIHFEENTSSEQLHQLLNNEIDIAFHHSQQVPDSVHTVMLDKEVLGIVLPETHPLKERASIDLKMLKEDRWILFPKAMNPLFYESIMQLFYDSGFTPDIVNEISPRQNAVSLVSAGLGITFLSPSLQHYCTERTGVIFKQLKNKTPDIHYFASWKRDVTNPVAEYLIRTIRDQNN